MLIRLITCLLFFLPVIPALAQTSAKEPAFVYACPPCDKCDTLRFKQAGLCPVCGMTLEKISLGDWQERVRLLHQSPKDRISVALYLQDGVEVLDFAGPMEVFTAANFNVFTVSKTTDIIRSQGALWFKADYDIQHAPPADVTVIFGGETATSAADTALMTWMRNRIQSGKYTMSVCTGAFILAKTGMLDNKTATTFHSMNDILQRQYPNTKVLHNVRVVDNGTIITTAGVSAGIDGALHLVERLKGRQYAKSVADLIEYDKWVPDQGLVLTR
jgi:transcriptional regulator GlxA family with amidase domain